MPKADVWRIDGMPIDATPQTITGQLLATVPDLEFRSVEALKDLFTNLLFLSIEMALIEKEAVKGTAQGALTRHITATRKQMKHIPVDRERLLITLFDKILHCEGLGLLVGFGFGNHFGDTIRGNSERESSVVPINIYQKEKEKMIMATKKKDDGKIKRSELIAAAKEMNIILEPDPEIEVNLPSNELIVILANAKELLEPTDTVTPATKKVLANLPMVEEFAVLVEKEAAEKALPVEKEKEVPVVEKEPEKKTEPTAKKETPVKMPTTAKTKPAENTPAKKTRPQVFLDIIEAGGGTKPELIEAMKTNFGGSTAEAAYQVGSYIKILVLFNVLTKDETGKITRC